MLIMMLIMIIMGVIIGNGILGRMMMLVERLKQPPNPRGTAPGPGAQLAL